MSFPSILLFSHGSIIFPGRKHENFWIGMGVGLVFLLAKSAAEFNKMIQLRAETEMMLKEIKQEVRRKDAIASSSESNNNISFSPSHCWGDIKANQTTSMPSAYFALQAAKCDVESDRHSKYDTAFANTRSVSIDQMEAELEVELEHLQNNLEGEGSSTLQQRMEVYFLKELFYYNSNSLLLKQCKSFLYYVYTCSIDQILR